MANMDPPPARKRRGDEDDGSSNVKRVKEGGATTSRFEADAKEKLSENFGDEVKLKAKRQRDQAAVVNSDDEDEENPDAEKALDSDDDEVLEKENQESVGARRLNLTKIKQDRFEGEANTSVQEEDGQQFTAFNLNEEKEEGRFDKYGNYERVYEKEQTHDAWADSVEWSKDQIEKNAMKKIDTKAAEGARKEEEDFDECAALMVVVGHMLRKETVLSALRRLGASAAPKPGWKSKRDKKKAAAAAKMSAAGAAETTAAPTADDKKTSEAAFAALTTAADNLLRSGHVTVYEDTFEKLTSLLKTKQEAGSTAPGTAAIMWEYRVGNTRESELHGPFSTEQMIELQTQGQLGGDCWCRRLLPSGERTAFYSSKRVDFDDWI